MNSFTDPYSPRGDEQILASHIRSHTRAIRELQAKLAPFRKAKRSVKRPFHFQVTGGGAPVSGNYKVLVRGGYVLNRVVSSGTNAIVRVIPEVEIDSSFESLPPEETVELELTASQAVFVKITTDDMDVFDGTNPIQIVVASSTEISDQAQPIDDENPSGIDGVYYYPLATLSVDDDDIATVKQIQQGGPIVHDPLLWAGQNIGTGAEVYRGRNAATNKMMFRGIRGVAPLLAEVSGDNVDVSADGWWGTCSWSFQPAGGGSPITMDLTFHGGVLTSVTASVLSGDGTQATPGNAALNMVDTDT